uniref:Beta-catenin-like protein 2 n=1 Tax=Schmidtea mediterranea TaxID=79327 RepID=B1NTA6_SCHMD|nr:beta-catenin-like protein 2 [Schmidtea mediterranea]
MVEDYLNGSADRGNRTNRLKETIFPEESIEIVPSLELSYSPRIISSMIRMQKPAQRLRFLVTNMIDYIEDTDTAVEASENLSELLSSKNSDESDKAAQFVHNLCKKQASRLGLASDIEVIDGLKKKIVSCKNKNTKAECISSVQHISKGEQGATNIVNVNFIPILLDLLSSNDLKIVECVISTLDNLMYFVNQSRDIIRNSHGIEKLVEQMDRNDVKLLTVVLNCLHKLTFNNYEAKKTMLLSHGSEKVVQILRQYTYEKLLFAASKLLKVLSVCNKPILVETGAMEALHSLLRSGSPRLVLSSLWSIRNLSDYSSHIADMQKLLQKLIELLGSDDEHTSICSMGCLCNLTSGNTENKLAFIEYGGVQAVCQLICERVGQEEVVEPGVAALRHVTHNNHLAQQAIDIIIQSPLLSNLSVLIRGQPDKMLPLIKAIVGLLRNLSMISPQCRRSLMLELGITNSLCEIFYRTSKGISDLSQQRNSIVSVSSELSFIEGVRLDDLLELTLAALQALAKDNLAKKIISYENRLLQSVVQMVMIKENSVPLHRACLGLLAEMVEYADCARILEGEGFNTRLSELIHSTNKAISTYAAIVMYVINLNKPEEYRNRLNGEIFESLQDKLATLEEDDMISYSQNSDNYGSQTQLQATVNARYQSPRVSDSSKFYDNQAFEEDVNDFPRKTTSKGKIRQKKPQPFRDVEL